MNRKAGFLLIVLLSSALLAGSNRAAHADATQLSLPPQANRLPYDVASLPRSAKISRVKRMPLRYTRKLPRIDKVELQRFKTKEMWFESVEASKLIEGREAQAIAALWRTQNYNSFNAICHYPVFGIKFYSQEKMIFYASLCWECDNILVLEPSLGARQGFDGGSRKGQELLKVFTTALP